MLHYIAYGNSDQASFRDPEVRNSFDILTVPSTIASYYADATAAFVLSSELDYMIEPRTPLFQGLLQAPRASHFTLASMMGSAVRTHMSKTEQPQQEEGIHFPVEFYTDEVCREMVLSMIEFQREYGYRANDVRAKVDRYRQLLNKATGGHSSPRSSNATRSPAHVLCPYFAVQSFHDEWWRIMERIWRAAQRMDDAADISPVIAMSDISALQSAIERAPDGLSSTVFYWIPSFDERRADIRRLSQLKNTVKSTTAGRPANQSVWRIL